MNGLRPAVQKAVAQFVERYPQYSTRRGARGTCYYAARHLWAMLMRAKVGCHVVRCENHKDPALWNLKFHCLVVSVDGMWVLDPTVRQFAGQAESPPVRVMSLSDIQRDWTHYRKIPFDEFLKGSRYRKEFPRLH